MSKPESNETCLHCKIKNLVLEEMSHDGQMTGSDLRDAICHIARSLGEMIAAQPVPELRVALYNLAGAHISHAINLASAQAAEIERSLAATSTREADGLEGTPMPNAPGSNVKN